MGRCVWLGVFGAAMLAPGIAYASAGDAATFVPVLVLAAFCIGGILLLRTHRRRLEAEQARLAASLAESTAQLAALPVAAFRLRAGEEPHRLAAGPLAGQPGCEDWDGFLAALDPESRAALTASVAPPTYGSAGFSLPVRLAAQGRALDAVGVPIRRASGTFDLLVTLADAVPRTNALDERDRLRAMIDAVPRPMWRRRRSDLALVDCNAAYAAAIDSSVETALTRGRELGAGIIPQGGRAIAAKARETNEAQSGTYHFVIGGSRRLMEITEVPLGPDEDLIGYANDLTELEAKEADLGRHIAAHAEVLENVAAAIAIYGPDTRLTFYNAAFARLWPLEEEWLDTRPAFDEVLERLRERRRLPELADFRAFKRQQRAMFTSLLSPQEELLHLPDERTLRLVVGPHPFGGLIFAYEDVTDRLALERSYNTLIEVQRATLDHLYEAIAVFGSDGRLKLWNPAYAAIWHLLPDDLAGEPHVSEIIEKTRSFYDDGGDWPALKRDIIARITGYGAHETRLERRDGAVLKAVTLPLPDGNILLSDLDVTDSTRVEEALRERNEALETAGRLKSEFVANVSYELRTPLNVIIGFSEILTNQYFGELNPRQLEYSRGILESSNRLLSLINDILDLATIEAGYMQLETHEIDIHAMMSGVLALTREPARNAGLAVRFDCPTTIGTVNADERRLKQALFNLVSNALKFTLPGGTVTLSAYRQGDRVALVVADTGVGVPEQDQTRIFERFERGNPRAQSGPGLGLSLVKSFIELHGGTVDLDSRPGVGTTVTCWLNDREETPALRSAG